MDLQNKNNSPKPTFDEEKKLWSKGYEIVIGVDEVGRGCFAGPVVTAAVVFENENCDKELLEEVNDSKLLKYLQRKRISKKIKEQAKFWTITTVGVTTINKIGIGKSTHVAFRKSIKSLSEQVKSEPFLLVDGFHVKFIKGIGLKHQKAIIKGDQKCFSIAAASVIAKDYRDTIMRSLSKKYPEYGFGRNKGYGTKEHQKAIKNHGLTKIHRTSFNLEKFL